MARYQEAGPLTDLEFAEFADAFLGYAEQPFQRIAPYMPEPSARVPHNGSSSALQWTSSPVPHQDCLSADDMGHQSTAQTSGPMMCLSPSAGSSEDSLLHLDAESSGRKREVQSSGGRAKRPTSMPVRKSSGSISKARGSDRAAVSHSTVEKQRRDRINSLIDELRELVPVITPWPKSDQQGEQKRPKHLVLADTITLLKQLQDQVKAKDAQVKELSACVTAVKVEQPQSYAASPTSSSDPVNGILDIDYQLPVPAPQESQLHMQLSMSQQAVQVVGQGITIEEVEGGCLYLRVNCLDRPGLLSDIMMALRNLPLDIRRASISTDASGQVHDMFELVPLDPLLTASEVSAQVQQALRLGKTHMAAPLLVKQEQGLMMPQGSGCLGVESPLPWDLLP